MGRAPYETTCSLCARGFAVGQTVEVAVSPRNLERVTIVPGTPTTARTWAAGVMTLPAGTAGISLDLSGRQPPPPSPRAGLVEELTRLGRLHAEGALTDAEFAAWKGRILDELGDDPPYGTPV